MYAMEKEERGAFWATYFNTAVNNLLSVTQYLGGERRHVAERGTDSVAPNEQNMDELEDGGFKKFKQCAAIQELLKTGSKANLTRQLRLVKSFGKYFPFMRLLREYHERASKKPNKEHERQPLTPQEFCDFFLGFAEFLYELRNYFTHVKHAPVQLGNMKSCYPRVLFEASVRTVKERFYKNDGKEDRRFNHYRKYRGMDEETKKPKDNPDYRFYLWEKDSSYEMTPQGLAFFASLFLEKKYVSMMLDSVGLEKNQEPLRSVFRISDEEKDMTLLKRVYMVRCIRLPRTRLECEEQMTDQTLGLDILSHLHKCPKEIFELLSPNEQEQFRTISEKTGQEVLLMRNRDRFPYLALNYLDRQEIFSKIRFCVNMGNYYYRCHPRKVIDGSVLPDRRIPKRILWFQRIQDAVSYYREERVRPGTLYHLPQEFMTPPAVYRNDMFPQYYFRDNQIGFCTLSAEQELPHPELDPEGKTKPKMRKPDGWLSLYELPIVLYLSAHGKAREVEECIARYIENWRGLLEFLGKNNSSNPALIKAEMTRRGLEIRNLPEELQYYLKHGKVKPIYLESEGPRSAKKLSVEDAAEIWLRKAIDQTDRLLRGMERDSEYDFKLGKSKKAKFHRGHIARWLVRDFMYLQQSNENSRDKFGKIKSAPDYMALQAVLTCFRQHKDSIEDILRNARLIDEKTFDHPFLKEVLKKPSNLQSLDAFFKGYLVERKKWLRRIDGNEAYPLRRLYRRGEYKSKRHLQNMPAMYYLQQMAKKLLEEPVNLPRNLFEPMVRDLVKNQFPHQWQEESMDTQRANSTWLIMKALEWSNDRPQWFFELPRSMDSEKFGSLFAILGTSPRYDTQGMERLEEILKLGRGVREREIRDSLQRDRDFSKLEHKDQNKEVSRRLESQEQMYRRLLRQYGEYEKDIRHIKIQDIALLKTLPQLLGIPAEQIRLKDMKPETGQSDGDFILNEIVPLKMMVVLPDQGGKVELTGTMKRKNYGNFHRMISDVRLPSCLWWRKEFGLDTVSYDHLEKELEYYDRVARPDIFQLVYALEQKILAKCPELKPDGTGGEIKFWTIACNATNNNLYRLVLSILRNAFAHQYYPMFQPNKKWKPKEIESYGLMLQNIRNEIRSLWERDPEKLLIRAIHEYAKTVFQKVFS
ncbi:MAG: type VI-B CRISPR-associated RNA-guided ribonuclease Cas13b [Planctomycetia bacterium]|nr:type VI-B CRISPR-associated RNA-guided ribonuclease Cas13b [Planctomycetia bacterium]